MSRRVLLPLVLLLLLSLGGGGVLIARHAESEHEREAACGGEAKGSEAEREREKAATAGKAANGPLAGLYTGPGEVETGCPERPGGHPESFADLAKANSSLLTRQVAPGTAIKPGAYRSAVRSSRTLPVTGGDWTPFGNSPAQTYRAEYDTSRGSTNEGLGDIAGRATAFARDDAGTIYVAASNGGIWKSTDAGANWTSIGDGLPTQVVSGVAWSKAGGGTLVVLTGDNAYGGDTYAGQGAYRSTDGGATWTHASGIPDGVLGFELKVDPTDPSKVYAATGAGLFRSTDAGASYTNTTLPTGDCAGKAPSEKNCFLANMVTSVVVQDGGGKGTAKPGAVMAAVGWRAGTKNNAAGAPQSPGNGMYTSDTGAAGTFAKVAIPTTSQSEIGRVALGIANGPEQDHNVVYAMVQDANKFNGGAPVLDVNEQPSGTVPFPEVFNGLYVSTDFGSSWKQLASADQLKDVTTNSAIAPACEAPIIAYCPGVQAWYNLWVSPDPTRATSAGIPTRLAFGLEEVWTNDPTVTPPTGLDGTTPARFDVVGRYYGGTSCTIVPLVNDTAPICPVASGGTVPKFTTHPDQHGSMWVPDGSGGVDLYAANDGGVYKQHVAAGDELDNDGWSKTAGGPSGHNNGMHTLQPYDAAMAKDGTAYMGLQDNGELKIDPNGDSYTIYGGDGFFTAVDPDNSNTAYEEYTGGDVSVTSDGGKTWTDIQPTGLTGAMFSTPFEMDRNDAKHLVIGGRTIHETTDGAGTTSGSWKQVYDLGTQKHPGDASAAAAAGDPNNQLSAVDTLSFPTPSNAPTGPKTPDFGYTSGDTTFPGLGDQTGSGVFLPGTYDDHPFTIKPSEGDASVTIDVTWADSTNDWDLYVYRVDNGSETEVGSSANGSTTEEKVTIPDPKAGDYVIRVVNFTATGSFDSKVTFAQRTTQGVDPGPSATYVGYCGYCDTVTQGTPFANGIATNVTAAKLGTSGAGDNWHIAAAKGLPTRYITSVRMDPSDPRTVYVTLAGYGRRWAFPGALGEDTSKIGTGHVFKSTNAGETFSDVSGDLPDTPANWSVLHNGHLVVGTDIGVFESCDSAGGAYSVLGRGLPTTPVTTMRFKPGDPDLLLTATYGRGAYTYRFVGDNGRCAAAAGAPGTTGTRGPTACASARGFKSVKVTPTGRRGLRFAVVRRVKAKFTVDVFQQARGRKVIGQRRIAHFPKRAKSFTWKGAKGTDGLYFVRVSVKAGGTTDARRPVFQRVGGRFRKRPAFYGNASCRILRLAKLSGPAFGGVKRTALGIALQTGQKADVVVTATRKAGKQTKRLKRWTIKLRDTKTHRLTLPSRKAKAGDVQVTLLATAGTVKQTVKLTSKRLR